MATAATTTATTTPTANQEFNWTGALKSLYDLWNSQGSKGDLASTAANSSQQWNEQLNKAETNQGDLKALITSLQGKSLTPTIYQTQTYTPDKYAATNYGPMPSELNGGYVANAGPSAATGTLAGYAAGDRANMLAALAPAAQAAAQRVQVADYNTDNVQNRATQKYSSMVGGLDRAAAIAASQGFAQALKGGVANSTAAATKANNMTREFSDLYSKLSEEADASAMAENKDVYASYLSGKNTQIDQNAKVAQSLAQVLSQTASKASSSEGNYASSATNDANRMIDAIKAQDNAWLQRDSNDKTYALGMTNASNGYATNMQQLANNFASNLTNQSYQYASNQNNSANSLLANLFNVYGSNQQNLVENARIKYAADAGNASAVAKTTGQAGSNLLDALAGSPIGKDLAALVNQAGGAGYDFIKSLFGSTGSTGTGLVPNADYDPTGNGGFYYDAATGQWKTDYSLTDGSSGIGLDPGTSGIGLNTDGSGIPDFWRLLDDARVAPEDQVQAPETQYQQDYSLTSGSTSSGDPWDSWILEED